MVCYNCFKEKSSYGPCPFCGYDSSGAEERFPLALKAGSILNGRYTVGRVIGQGGFGITYIAQDYQTRERVAIKEYFPSEFAGRSGTDSSIQVHSKDQKENFEYGKEQFLQEAKTLAAFIGDEHIVRIYSYFEENNTAYFVMEYVDGYALDKYMAQKGGRLSVEEANRLLLPLMPSLDKVHSKGIIHRDIAPDNIIVTKDGNTKLIDFGAARYSTGEKSKSLDVILKHGFAPAEQYMRRGKQGPYTDVYALAATYYYAVTGKILPDAVERMADDTMFLPSSLGVKISAGQEEVLLKALEVSYNERYHSMREFYHDMASASESVSEGVRGKPSTEKSPDLVSFSIDRTEQEAKKRAERLERELQAAKKEAARLEQERLERENLEGVQNSTAEKKKQEAAEFERQARRRSGKCTTRKDAEIIGNVSGSTAIAKKPKKKKKARGTILLIVVMLILTGLAGGYVYCYNTTVNNAKENYFGAASDYLIAPYITSIHDPDLCNYISGGFYFQNGDYGKAIEIMKPLAEKRYLDSLRIYKVSGYSEANNMARSGDPDGLKLAAQLKTEGMITNHEYMRIQEEFNKKA